VVRAPEKFETTELMVDHLAGVYRHDEGSGQSGSENVQPARRLDGLQEVCQTGSQSGSLNRIFLFFIMK
jgi:hypothetical protein